MFSLPDEIIADCIDEVAGYVPSLTKEIEALRDPARQASAVQSLLEQVNTIKGAASLVNLAVLNHMAAEMETTLRGAADSDKAVSDELISVMVRTVDDLQRYCTDIKGEGVPSRQLLHDLILSHRELRRDPGDAAVSLEALLEPIPDHEKITVEAEEEAPEELPGAEELSGADELPDLSGPDKLPEAPEPPGAPPARPLPSPSSTSSIPPELLESYYEEANEHLEDLDSALNGLASKITSETALSPEYREVIRGVRRSVHTIKGAAAVIGLQSIADWGHIMEDFLDWLFDDAQTITPDTISLLMESGDLLAHIVAHSDDPRPEQAESLAARYSAATTLSSGAPQSAGKPQRPQPEPSSHEPDDAPVPVPEIAAQTTQTLRIHAERVDELVNLIGEIMITSGGFEQHMNQMLNSLNDLEAVRGRFREIAKEVEVGYEVKALSRMVSPGIPGKNGEPVHRKPAEQASGRSEPFDEFDSLELDRYSKLNLIIRTLNDSVVESGVVNNRISAFYSDFEGNLNRQRVLLSELQDKMMHLRMLPMTTITNRLLRTVREITKIVGKKATLVITGEEIELDRIIWEKLSDPLMHLIRNALDHGVESPEIRIANGKAEAATLYLAAAREGNQVIIRLSDDGSGLNYDAIRQKAIKNGLTNASVSLSDKELAGLIFKPGFSTCDTISQVSGRGVGMDVVRENVQELKGTIRVTSSPGKGTSFAIRIPLTLAALRALLFSVAGQTYAVALTEVREILRATPEQILHDPHQAIRIENEMVPYYVLKDILPSKKSVSVSESPLILIVETGGKKRALEVDALLGQKEIVIKSTGTHLRHVKGIAGAAIIGDGSIAPILNIPELIGEDVGISDDQAERAVESFEPISSLSIMIVDDSISIRKVVSGLVENQGWTAMSAKDGQDALDQLKHHRPDLIVLDVEMPRMNGFEFLAARAAQHEYSRIPVVMLTSRSTTKHSEKALSLGANGFMGKPFNSESFIELIQKLAKEAVAAR